MTVRAVLIAGACLAGVTWIAAQSPAPLDDVRRVFDAPPDDARLMMRWWWFGPAVTEAQVSADLEKMKAGGIGGAEIQPVYPLALDAPDGARNLAYLSDEFLAMLGAANAKAAALGLRLDLTLGSGWPFGGATVGILDAASRLRLDRIVVPPGAVRVARPAMSTGETWIAAFVGPDGNTPATGLAMTRLEWPEGQDFVVLPAARHPRQVWSYIAGRTGMQVKRPSVNAEGYVLSHHDRGALHRYLDRVGARLLQPFGSRVPFAIFCDSLEVYDSDWSPDFAAEFARRRGYDIVPLLPMLSADRGNVGAMAREDWGRTLTELLDERFISPLAAWAHERGTKLRMQGYGIPPASVSSNAALDLPEGEGHHWREVTAARWASSAAHLYDKRVATSETWTWLHSPAFRATPLDVKAEADRHFLQGITQLIGHGWPSTPESEAYPGWRFYAAGVFNDRNPWWLVMRDVSRYLQRVSAVLRQGRPGNDVALYLPISDAYAHASLGRMHLLELVRERIDREVFGAILDAGLGFDLVDDGALTRGTMQGGEWTIGASRFRAIVVPDAHAVPAETLAALERFAESGGVVIATGAAPSRPAGRSSPDEQVAFANRAKALFSRPDGRAVVLADVSALGRALNARVPPALRITRFGGQAQDGRAVPSEIGVIERRVGDASVFFVVNTSNQAQGLRIGFGTPGAAVDIWNPSNDQTGMLATDASGSFTMTLAPYESRFVVRTGRAAEASWVTTADSPGGDSPERRVLGPWTVTAGATTWTEDGASPPGWQAREATRHFSGVATYETVVNLPTFDRERQSAVLDFGEGTPVAEVPRRNGYRAWLDAPVREAAWVDVNGGKVVVPVWAPPYRADITVGLQAGDNRIRIRVGNTAMNHMAGQSPPNYRLLNLRYGERFVPQDMDQVQVLPSGITQPARLVVTQRVRQVR